MTSRPTTQNSMTHYALTEEQEGVLAEAAEGEGGDIEGALMEALQSTPNDISDTRVKTAILSGLLVPELLPSRMQEEQDRRDGREEDDQQQGSLSERYEDESEDDYQLRLQQEDEARRQQQDQR